jgi:cbb3-type cytochrome oxidase maturation protein
MPCVWQVSSHLPALWQLDGFGIPMDILYLLIPLSLVLVLGIMGLFWWALQSGQFDNIEREGERILRGD